MALATKVLALGHAPIDLAADADISTELPTHIAMQNISSGKLVFFADVDAQPADASRAGLILRYGVLAVFRIDAGDHLWAWTTSASCDLAVTNAEADG